MVHAHPLHIPFRILDLTEEFIRRLDDVCEEAAQAVNEYVAKMNDVGPLPGIPGNSAYRTLKWLPPQYCICMSFVTVLHHVLDLYVL